MDECFVNEYEYTEDCSEAAAAAAAAPPGAPGTNN